MSKYPELNVNHIITYQHQLVTCRKNFKHHDTAMTYTRPTKPCSHVTLSAVSSPSIHAPHTEVRSHWSGQLIALFRPLHHSWHLSPRVTLLALPRPGARVKECRGELLSRAGWVGQTGTGRG